MEFKGIIEYISPIEKGTSANGKEWEKAYVVITDGKAEYPNRVKVEMFGAKVANLANIAVGQAVTAHFNPSVNEWNGNHYQSLGLWKFEFDTAQQSAPAQQQEYVNPVEESQVVKEGESKLPF